MPATSFACPSCKRVLKSSTGLPVGKKVQCPGCKTAFVVSDEEKSAVQAKPPAAPRRKTMLKTNDDDFDDEPRPQRKAKYQDEDDDIPRKKRSRRDGDEEDDRPRRRSRRDDDDEDDDLPRSRRGGKKDKGGKTTVIVLLAGGAVGLLLIGFVITAFVWPGFLRSSTPLAPNDPVVFLPGDCDFVAGINLAPLRTHPEYQKAIDKVFDMNPQALPVQRELAEDAEAIYLGGKTGGRDVQGTLIFVMSKPPDAEKVRLAFNAAPPEQLQGKTIFRTKTGEIVSLPTSKIVLVVKGADNQVGPLLARTSPALNPDMLAQVQRLRSNTIWGLGSLDGEPRRKFQEINLQKLQNPFVPVQDLGDFVTALKNAKLATLVADVPADGKTLKVELGLLCANADDAGKGAASLTKVWDTSGKGILGFAQLGMMGRPEGAAVNNLLNEVTQNLKIQGGGDTITASLTLSEATLKELEKEVNKLPIQLNPQVKVPGNQKKKR